MGTYWICDACRSLNEPVRAACYKCRTRRGAAVPQAKIPGAAAPHSAEAVFGPGPVLAQRSDLRLVLLFGGLAAAGVVAFWLAAATSVSVVRLLRVTWLSGLVIGWTVSKAGRLRGRRRSFVVPFVAAGFAVVAAVAGTYLLASMGIAMAAGLSPWDAVLTPAPPDAVRRVVQVLIDEDPIWVVLFWVLSPISAWLLAWDRFVGRG